MTLRTLVLLSCLLGLTACSTAAFADSSTPSPLPPTATALPTTTPSTPTPVPSPTPFGCLTKPGKVKSVSLQSTSPEQEFLIYLPPCYDEKTDERYPVLYLLHGQTSIDDQWVRMGADKDADALIHSGQAAPFIMVFPDDRYWNQPPGPGFGDRLIHLIVPFVDTYYRTLPDRSHRAVGGLSRGGGWAIHMALTQYRTFGIVGLHSPVIFQDDQAVLQKEMAAVPANEWPRLWMDGGDRDGGLGDIRRFEALLTALEVPHEWRMYKGDHTEGYWSAHLTEYLEWYTQQFAAAAPVATPTP